MTGVRIGVFDSGLGGLSVVRALLERAPDASVIYLADIAHVPYGDRPLDQVRGFALSIVDFLLREGAGAILMACNMSSAVALDAARERWPDVPMAGVLEAGARAAVRQARGPVAVLATAGTVASGKYPEAITRLAPGAGVVQTACPAFVPLVEAGELSGPDVETAVREALAPGLERGAKTFVLGCTHYPFLLPELARQAPAGSVFIDPAGEAAAEILDAVGGALDTRTPSRYVLSAPSDTFRALGSRFLGFGLPEIALARWDEDGALRELRPAVEALSGEALCPE